MCICAPRFAPSAQRNMTNLSFEFFPTQTDAGTEKLLAVRDELAKYNPEFFSVTYGAGGSTRERTFTIVSEIHKRGIEAAPHLACVGHSKADIREILAQYKAQGIKRIVALRGDLPSGAGLGNSELRHASDLVEFIRQETGDYFTLEVAAYPEMHPQAGSFEKDLQHFAKKAKAGANTAITQYFFNPDSYFYFVERVRALGVDIPIVPGIMPITNYSKLARFSDACGAEIPRWIRKQLEAYGDDMDSITKFGEEVVTHLCKKLIAGGAPSIHFYTLNQAEPSLAVWRNLQ